MQFDNENEMLEKMVESIEQGTGLVLEPGQVKELLIEVQREQLKGVVYRAFLAVNHPPPPEAETAEPSPVQEG